MNSRVPNYNERTGDGEPRNRESQDVSQVVLVVTLISRSLKITRIHIRKSMSSVFIKFWWNMNFIIIHWNPSYSSLFTENKGVYDRGYILWLIRMHVLNIKGKIKQFIFKFELVYVRIHIKLKIAIFNTKNSSEFLLLKCDSYKFNNYAVWF